jgi:hypothetical protein
MADDSVKDVSAASEKKAVESEDNIRLEDISRGYKIFYLSKDHFLSRLYNIDSIRIYDKSIMSISRYGDELYTRTRNRLIKDPDMLTYDEQLRYLSERGLWSDEHEERLAKLREKVAEANEDKDFLKSRIVSSDSNEEVKSTGEQMNNVVKIYTDFFNEYSDLLTLNLTYFKDTLEMQAEMAQMKGWIVSSVTKNVGGGRYNPDDRLWKSIDDLNRDLKEHNFISIKDECVSFWGFGNSGGESFFAESPEELTSGSDGEDLKS